MHFKEHFNIDQFNFNEVLTDMIIDYCYEVINVWFNFEKMTFESKKYFKQIYLKNVDVYGFIMCYVHICTSANDYSYNLKKSISTIILNYCLNSTYAVKLIPIKQLFDDIARLPLN
jgi:hypothetical protein